MPKIAASLKKALASKPQRQGPLWTGPSGKGPNGGVTQGLIAKWLRCRERTRLLVVDGIKPVDAFSVPLFFGNCWHTCEEWHARGKDWRFPLQAFASMEAKKRPSSVDLIAHWSQVVATQFPVYVEHWADHPHVVNRKPVVSEQAFNVPYELPSGQTVRLRGKWDGVDLVGAGKDAGMWLQEHKTKSRIEEVKLKQRLTFDLQTMLYLIALTNDTGIDAVEKVKRWDGKRLTVPIIGVRYNVVRRDCPIRQHAAKQNKAKKTFTPAETEEHFYDRLRRDYFEANPEDWFMRWEVAVSSADVRRFKTEFLDPCLSDICDWYDAIKDAVSPFFDKPYHYRTPYGVGIVDDWDDYGPLLETGSEFGYERTEVLFPELVEEKGGA